MLFDEMNSGGIGECDADVDEKERAAQYLALVEVRARAASGLLGRI
jgi:hypothetical protein